MPSYIDIMYDVGHLGALTSRKSKDFIYYLHLTDDLTRRGLQRKLMARGLLCCLGCGEGFYHEDDLRDHLDVTGHRISLRRFRSRVDTFLYRHTLAGLSLTTAYGLLDSDHDRDICAELLLMRGSLIVLGFM